MEDREFSNGVLTDRAGIFQVILELSKTIKPNENIQYFYIFILQKFFLDFFTWFARVYSYTFFSVECCSTVTYFYNLPIFLLIFFFLFPGPYPKHNLLHAEEHGLSTVTFSLRCRIPADPLRPDSNTFNPGKSHSAVQSVTTDTSNGSVSVFFP